MPNIKMLALTVIVLLALGALFARWWLRPPAVAEENLRYLPLLRTAISARSPQWLAGVERAVRQQQQAGRLSAEERRHFDKIIATARGGDWESADRLALGFETSQSGRQRRGVKPQAACCQE